MFRCTGVSSLFVCVIFGCCAAAAQQKPLMERVEEGYAENGGVKIHYAAVGQGPLLVFVHGFPDFWYSWRHQMEALSGEYRCVAMDLRGYNRSDKPEGQANYDTQLLVGDVVAVITAQGASRATVIGHDWGGMIAWATAMYAPEAVERLIICNLPHPRCFMRELAHNPEQQQNSHYARKFQEPDAAKSLTPEILALMVSSKDPKALPLYQEAFRRSNIEAMLNYYRQNYPREPYTELDMPFPKVKAPVLQFHGLEDKALLASGLSGTWEHIDAAYTLVTVPGAGHWVHHDKAALVSDTIRSWLALHR